MTQNSYKLIIFDVDYTLADPETGDLLPGVSDWFEAHGDGVQIAVASNQGGVGLRHWMEVEHFGRPRDFPTRDEIQVYLECVIARLPERFRPALTQNLRVCFAYQSKKSGKWSPTPGGCEGNPDWLPENRKPAPGMLRAAMQAAGAGSDETLMVGDSDDDQGAAAAATCAFAWADDFFGRKTDKEDSQP